MPAPSQTLPRRLPAWTPLALLSLPARVAIWSGWVALGTLCGFGKVQPLPGLWDALVIDTRVTLPVGMETYAAYALRVWLTSPAGPARRFAKISSIAALALGALGQVAYHLMSAAGVTVAPWPVVALVAVLPVGVLGMGAALSHLHAASSATDDASTIVSTATDADPREPAPSPSGALRAMAQAARPTPALPALARAGTPDPTLGGGAPAADLKAEVRALAEANPAWTQARIAAEAGCSVRTVRRHLNDATSQREAA